MEFPTMSLNTLIGFLRGSGVSRIDAIQALLDLLKYGVDQFADADPTVLRATNPTAGLAIPMQHVSKEALADELDRLAPHEMEKTMAAGAAPFDWKALLGKLLPILLSLLG